MRIGFRIVLSTPKTAAATMTAQAEPWKVTPPRSQPVSPSTSAFAAHETSSHLNMGRNATASPGRMPSAAADRNAAGSRCNRRAGIVRSTVFKPIEGWVTVLADYSFWSFFWDVLLFMAWIIWFWLLITVFADLFRRHDTSGFAKVLWIIFVIIIPYFGVLIYLLVEHQGMADRNMKQAEASEQQFDQYVRSVGGGDPAEQIAKAQALLKDGAISRPSSISSSRRRSRSDPACCPLEQDRLERATRGALRPQRRR